RVWRTGLPVRSAVLKPHAGRLVVGWVTTSESLLLYVLEHYSNFLHVQLTDQSVIGEDFPEQQRLHPTTYFFEG
ncbi:hypothetical protein BO94DRAFT_471583, partial [Aspergillus sclerotioniger CBS 115572]